MHISQRVEHREAVCDDGCVIVAFVELRAEIQEIVERFDEFRPTIRRTEFGDRLSEYPQSVVVIVLIGAANHRQAMDLVTRIVNTDQASLQSLTAAELARRDAVRAIERGETTLAAYRKVVTLAAGATLVDRRG